MFYQIKIALLLILSISVHAQDWLVELTSPFDEYESRLVSNPDAVLKLLLSHTPEENLNEHIQYQLLLSQTYYSLVYPQKAIDHAKQGLKIVTVDKQPWLFHRMNIALALAYDIAGSPEKGLKAVDEALQWAKSQHNNNLIIESLTTRGYILISMVEYIQALDSLQQAYALAPINGDFAKAEVAGIIALVYEYRHEDALAIPYFTEAANHHRKNNNSLELSIALYGLGRARSNTGETEQGKKELQESADISLEINDLQGQAYALKELAGIAIGEKQYKKSEELFLKALEPFNQANNIYMQFDVNVAIARLYTATKQLDKAQKHLDAALTYIDEKQQPMQYISLLKHAADIVAAKGDFKTAFADLRKVMFKEKVQLAKQSTDKLHRLRSKYELESKEKENKILAQNIELNNAKIEAQTQKNRVLQLLFFFAITISSLLISIAYRIQKNKKHFEQLANVDGLTQLYTRTKSLEILEMLFEKAKQEQSSFCVAMIDLDHFKRINDNFGHITGDKVLKKIGLLIKNVIRKTDICGRFGGEEFLIGFIDTDIEETKDILQNLRKKTLLIADDVDVEGIEISLSAGLCQNQSFESLDDMIKCADDNLYQAKENGRNTIVSN